MSLDLSKLQNVREFGSKTTARCPACAEKGVDEKGEHLVIRADGRFGCVVHPGDGGKAHRQRIFAVAGKHSVSAHVIKVRIAASSQPSASQPVPVTIKVREHSEIHAPEPNAPHSMCNEPKFAPPLWSLNCGHPNFREPEDGELIVGIYHADDGAPVPLLLWADPNVDLFWDVARREHVKPPGLYLQLSEQPQIDPVTGFPVIEGAVCPF